jgi:hypothetical protein
MRRVLTLAPIALASLVFVSLGLVRSARADGLGSLVKPVGPGAPEDVAPPPIVDHPAERRAGVALGLNYGFGLGSSAGYPNDSSLIGDPDYYSASGLMAGGGDSLFIMGALSDALNFGFWFGSATFANKDWHSTGEGGGFRLEVFPLFSLGRAFRDLAAFTQVGIGGTDLVYKGKPNVSSDGVESFIGVGAFYEFWLCRALGGHLALGPSLEYDAIVTQPIERHGALLGFRFVWYGGK